LLPKAVFGRDFFELEPGSVALLVIDMQNEFVESGANFSAFPKSIEIIPNIERIVDFARNNSMPIIWTLCDHGPPGGGLVIKKFPPIREQKILWIGTRSFQLYSKMTQPLPNEYQIVKPKFDAFFGTNLEHILRNLKVDSIVVTGISTEVCCESTARSAFHREFQVAFVSDATATRTGEAHNATLKAIDNYFGRVLTTDELLSELSENQKKQHPAPFVSSERLSK
jgi:nicotinamidase-related amidase